MNDNYEELTIRDSFMFGKVMKDLTNQEILIRALLQEDIEIDRSVVEKYIQDRKNGKYVRLDLYALDTNGKVYDAEMQNRSKNQERQYELPRRSRYYQCMLDGDLLKPGKHYTDLNDTCIIFICGFDPFKEGLYRYTVEPKCLEKDDVKFDDGTTRIFFNLDGDMSAAPEGVKNMLQYIKNGDVTDEAAEKLEDAVQAARENEEWRSEYMLTLVHDRDMYADGYTDGMEKGEEKGIAKGIAKGKAEGKAEGRAEGIAQGRTQEIYQCVQDGDLRPQRAAEKLGISMEQLENQMAEAGFGIPINA